MYTLGKKSVTEFWPLIYDSYPKVAERAINALLPFVSTYICKSGFSALMQMKTKQRSRLEAKNELRFALPSTSLRIQDLAKKNNRRFHTESSSELQYLGTELYCLLKYSSGSLIC